MVSGVRSLRYSREQIRGSDPLHPLAVTSRQRPLRAATASALFQLPLEIEPHPAVSNQPLLRAAPQVPLPLPFPSNPTYRCDTLVLRLDCLVAAHILPRVPVPVPVPGRSQVETVPSPSSRLSSPHPSISFSSIIFPPRASTNPRPAASISSLGLRFPIKYVYLQICFSRPRLFARRPSHLTSRATLPAPPTLHHG